MANGKKSGPQGKKKTPQDGGRSPFSFLGGPSFMSHLMTTILVFLLLMSGYSLFAGFTQKPEEISLSQVASDVVGEKITEIKVAGDDLTLTYTDGSEKISRKDPVATLPETLITYGVTPERLAKVAITVEGQSGLR